MAEERYTLEQAAAKIGFRADDLAAALPDAGIDLNAPGHEGGTLSGAEVDRLSRLAERIKKMHENSLYSTD